MSTPTPLPNPRVGVAAVVLGPDGRVVFGRRKGSHGAGQWAFPGGHLEHGEGFAGCAERETLEETGLRVEGLRSLAVTNDVFPDLRMHYITIFVLCRMLDPQQEPQVMEPNKCEGWAWLTFADISRKSADELFLPVQHLLKQVPQIEELLETEA